MLDIHFEIQYKSISFHKSNITGGKVMHEIFDRYRKAIITGGGVIVFILAGLLTMLLTGNQTPYNVPSSTKSQSSQASLQSQNQNSDSIPSSPKTPQPQRIIYAYITGEVKSPGVYKLSDDTRIFQLIDMAGGFTQKADRESLNLAETINNGTHIHIGAKLQGGDPPTIPGLPAGKAAVYTDGITAAKIHPQSSAGKININTANTSQLEALPGVGPAIAKRIIDYRNTHGNFARPEDLVNVRGIGQSKLSKILPHITASSSGTRVAQHQSSAGKININTANTSQLETLPGVGPAIAKRIIDYRNTHGNFASLDDLVNVRGISQAKLEGMKNQIVIR